MLTLSEYIARYPDPQRGPCRACGAKNYSLSMGGPGICPPCDSQPPERRVRQLVKENKELRERIAFLEGSVKLKCPDCGYGNFSMGYCCECGGAGID